MLGSSRFRDGAAPFAALRIAGQGSEFLAFLLLARTLDPPAFGTLSIGYLLARYAGLIGDWGATVRGTRDVAQAADSAVIRTLVRQRRLVSAVLAVVFVLAVVASGNAELAPIAFVVLSRGMQRDWMALGNGRSSVAACPSVIQGLGLLVGATLADSVRSAASLVGAAALGALCVSLALNPLPRVVTGDARPARLVDGWMVGAVLADQVTASADTVLLGWLRTPAVAGVYAAVYRLPNAWMTLLGLIVLGMLPATARDAAGDRRPELAARQRRAWRAGLGTAVLILVTSYPSLLVMDRLLGPSYASGREPLLVLMGSAAIMAVAVSMHPTYLAVRKDRDVFLLSSAGAAVNLCLNVALIPFGGMLAAACAAAVTQLVLTGILFSTVRRALA